MSADDTRDLTTQPLEHFPLTEIIANPGSVVPRRRDESIPSWSARAVLASPWLAAHVAAAVARYAEKSMDAGVKMWGDVAAERDEARAALGAVAALADEIWRESQRGTTIINDSGIMQDIVRRIRDRLASVSGAVAKPEQEVAASEGVDKDALWAALDALNVAGEEPTIAGVDAEGRAFLAYLAEEGGDATYPGVLFDEPHQTTYDMHGDRVCDECGCPQRHWKLDDLTYPVHTLAARTPGSDAR